MSEIEFKKSPHSLRYGEEWDVTYGQNGCSEKKSEKKSTSPRVYSVDEFGDLLVGRCESLPLAILRVVRELHRVERHHVDAQPADGEDGGRVAGGAVDNVRLDGEDAGWTGGRRAPRAPPHPAAAHRGAAHRSAAHRAQRWPTFEHSVGKSRRIQMIKGTHANSMATLLLWLPAVTASALGSAPPRTTAAAAALAETPLDALTTAAQSFALVGTACAGWTLLGQLRQSAPLDMALRASVVSAQKWARVSAGFSGGRAAAQVFTRTDGLSAAIAGAVGGAVLGANAWTDIPGRCVAFVALSYGIELLEVKLRASEPPSRRAAPAHRSRRSQTGSNEKRRVSQQGGRVSRQGAADRRTERNVFGEAAGAGFRNGGGVQRLVGRLNSELEH